MAQPEYTIRVNVVSETDKAIKVDSDGDIVWLPKSQVKWLNPNVTEGANITLPTWLYKEKFPDDIID